MKYGELCESKVTTEQWVKTYMACFSAKPVIAENGYITVRGNVDLNATLMDLHGLDGNKFPVKFSTVDGWFDCMGLKLTSLVGVPNFVGEYFDCSKNKLLNLEGGPRVVNDTYFAKKCGLTSLVGAPEQVHGLDVTYNNITSTKGAPKRIDKYLALGDNPIVSLHNIHKDIHFIGKSLYIDAHHIETSVLGLLMIDGDYIVHANDPDASAERNDWVDIINRFIRIHNIDKYDKVFECQIELIDAGYERLASL